ncbi:uncharacterized protein PFD1115c [Onthophagus taurus]|uniref:uncharacterized protein PFD1115c n=1 Tax=Onthophagus taurus TaxID=166361 RepID=UPI000C20E040|nr:uncharacterized protein LOC111417838 [Onthophagus taurus]
MFPIIDQNRHDNQTVHVHMHQVCSCMYPFYTTFRPPILTPFHLQPLPRPYNMHHYQFTQFNMSPMNVPFSNNSTMQNGGIPVAISPNLTGTGQNQQPGFDFGPPPRDRRSFDGSENPNMPQNGGGIRTNSDEIKESDSGLVEEYFLGPDQSVVHVVGGGALFSNENFTKFLEQGCVMAEKIAIRNQHRPCFKNIQNLCNRTRSEILKPSNTVSNIHSQGIPWATKDFIYAYVRLINCWHMLKGYLETKDGTLGNIDRELTSDFKNCYLVWEKNTKLLAGHMIRIFTNLDNNVSNPNLVQINKKEKNCREKITEAIGNTPNQAINIQTQPMMTQNTPQINTIKLEDFQQKNVINSNKNSISDLIENILLSESTNSPQDDDSENESRVYMKPGSYNVPKKGLKKANLNLNENVINDNLAENKINIKNNVDSSNSSPSIEFFETAQNVSAHYKKMGNKKKCQTNDKMWRDAQSAVPFLLDKINKPKEFEASLNLKLQEARNQKIDQNQIENNNEDASLKYFIDLNTLEHHSANIQEWLDNNNFFFDDDDNVEKDEENNSSINVNKFEFPHQVKVLQRKTGGGLLKKNVEISERKKHLDEDMRMILEDVARNLEKEGLNKLIGFFGSNENKDLPMENNEEENSGLPISWVSIKRRLSSDKYGSVFEFVRDFKNLLGCAQLYYEAHPDVLRQLGYFQERLEVLINQEFTIYERKRIKSDEIN